MFPHTGYAIEWVQCVIAMIAVFFTIWSVWDGFKDFVAVPKGEEARRTIGIRSFATEIFKLLGNLGFLVVGVSSVLLPPPYYGANAPSYPEIDVAAKLAISISRSCLIWSTVWLTIDSIVARQLRHQFIRRLRWNGSERRAPPVDDPKQLRKDADVVVDPTPRKNEV
jgi:hypothetical protein